MRKVHIKKYVQYVGKRSERKYIMSFMKYAVLSFSSCEKVGEKQK